MTTFGRAGGSLSDDASFARNAETAKAGRTGELATALVLDKLARSGGFAVLHDLRIPGSSANIDHVVVSGSKVWIIDSKLWKPGFYWTFGGKTRRGLEPAPHADKRGIPLAYTRLTKHLRDRGLDAKMQPPLMVVHSSRRGTPISIWAYRPASDPGARVRAVRPEQLSFPHAPADARIVAALTRLLN
jgi:hypothetical protein